MPHIQSKTVYLFHELSETAKERARQKTREWACEDSFWYESVIEDFITIAGLLGYETDHKSVYFSGFSSQGDGACFVGTFRSRDYQPAKLPNYAPQDAELQRINAELASFLKEHPNFFARISHYGHYSHEHSTRFACEELDADENEDITTGETEDAFKEISRDLMRWLYRQLEREYEWQNADEQIDDMLTANEYEFNEDGTRA